MAKIIIHEDNLGNVSVTYPSSDDDAFIGRVIQNDVKKRDGYKSHYVADDTEMPQSRNWRNAWRLKSGKIDIPLEDAKEAHKRLIVLKAIERVQPDEFGQKDFSKVKADVEAIDFDAIMDHETLYNTFPKSIEQRSGTRPYKMFKKDLTQ